MSESYPYLHVSRQLGVSYRSVLRLVDSFERHRDALLIDMVMMPDNMSGIERAVAVAVLFERDRRARALAPQGVAVGPPRGACS